MNAEEKQRLAAADASWIISNLSWPCVWSLMHERGLCGELGSAEYWQRTEKCLRDGILKEEEGQLWIQEANFEAIAKLP